MESTILTPLTPAQHSSKPFPSRHILTLLIVLIFMFLSGIGGYYLRGTTVPKPMTKKSVIPLSTNSTAQILNEDYIQSMNFPQLKTAMFADYDTSYQMPSLKEYSNTLYSFQYPIDFMLTDHSPLKITLLKQAPEKGPVGEPEMNSATIEITETDFYGAQTVSLNDWFVQTDMRKYFLSQGRVTQDFITGNVFTTTLGGEKAIFNGFQGYPGSLSYGIITVHKNKGYEISISGNVSGAAATFREIAATFKFTN